MNLKKYFFNEQNAATPEDMKHIAIIDTHLSIVETIMDEFKTSFPIDALIQPSPLGATFFYVNIPHEPKTTPDLEKVIFQTMQQTTPLDAFIISGEEPEKIPANVKAAKEISPNAQIVIVCRDPEFTMKELKNINAIDVVGADNIVSLKDVKDKLIEQTEMKTTPYIDDKISYYSHSVLLRDIYFETEGIKEALETIAKASQINSETANNHLGVRVHG